MPTQTEIQAALHREVSAQIESGETDALELLRMISVRWTGQRDNSLESLVEAITEVMEEMGWMAS